MRKKSNGSEQSRKPLPGAIARGTQTRSASATSSGTGVRGAVAVGAERPKSLMKRAGLATRGAAKQKAPAAGTDPVRQKSTSRPALNGRNQKVEERIAAASEELASGISQSASAAEELRRAMEQISSGAEEAASASHETLAVASSTATNLTQARERATLARSRTEALQALILDSSNQISAWANNIKQNGERQAASVVIIEQLSQQAINIR